MNSQETKYKKLPGRKRTSLWRYRLYLADDHILSVTTGSFSFAEHYKRFHFRDIQAITLRRTWSTLIKVMVAFVFTGLLAWAGWALGQEGGQVFWVLAAITAISGTIVLALGNSCRCHIQTAVQVEELHALNRIRIARKVMATIMPLIQAAQNEFSPTHLAAYQQEASKARFGAGPQTQATAPGQTTPTTGAR